MTRDLIGYGGAWPAMVWPGGSRLAVSVVVNFEEGAEWQVGDGDPRSEAIGEVVSVVPAGVRDQGQEQVFGYGMRAGLWRMLDALDAAGVPATFFACGRAVERAPALAATVAARGHETAVHGWRWRPHADYADAASEAADLDRTIATIDAATGERPVGFFCRGGESPWTRDLLRERGFLYTSNGFDDDLPYWDGRLLVVPYSLDSNDMKFFHPNGFVRAQDMVDYVADALDVLEAEAARGLPRLLNLGFHLRIVGRPGRFVAFRDILGALAARRGRLWLARRAEIARAFADQVPRAVTRIVLVNPNTDRAASAAMAAIAQAALPADVVVEVMTVASGSPLIVDPDGLAAAARAVAALGPQLRAAKPEGVIVSAFGDPGLDELRGIIDMPVTGIAEAGMAEAATGPRSFSVVTTTPALNAAIAATAARYGHGSLFRGTVATPGQPAVLLADPQRLIEALTTACDEAIRRHGAHAIVIGGGPLASAARALAGVVTVPLIQPVPAAARLALIRALRRDLRTASDTS